MAQYYCQFSEVLPQLTPDEENWLRQQLTYIYVYGGKEYSEKEVPMNLDLDEADWSGFRVWREDSEGCEDCDGDTLAFDYKFHDDTGWGRYLWIYVEDSGNPEHAAQLIQKFLRRFRPDQCWALTFSRTCSKPRVGDFGGGAIFVTADKIKWNHIHNFLEKERRSFNTKHGKE